MKKSLYSAVALTMLALGMAVFATACGQPATEPQSAKQYTCPMHPEVLNESPGKCPKCGMALELKK